MICFVIKCRLHIKHSFWLCQLSFFKDKTHFWHLSYLGQISPSTKFCLNLHRTVKANFVRCLFINIEKYNLDLTWKSTNIFKIFFLWIQMINWDCPLRSSKIIISLYHENEWREIAVNSHSHISDEADCFCVSDFLYAILCNCNVGHYSYF